VKILQIVHNWEYYNSLFNLRFNISSLSWDQIKQLYVYDGFNMGHILTPELNALGHETELIIPNNSETQQRWARLNGYFNLSDSEILIKQINEFKPDILYITDPVALDRDIIDSIKIRPKRVVAWRAAPIPGDADFRKFDIFLTSDLKLAPLIEAAGCSDIKFHLPGHRNIVEPLSYSVRSPNLVFSGSYGHVHIRRNSLLLQLAMVQLTGALDFEIQFYLATGSIDKLPVGIGMHSRRPLFGRELLEMYSSSFSTLHFPIDIAQSNATAMRMFEAIGQGCLMFVHVDAELFGLFEEDEIVRFSTPEDLINKHVFLRDNPSISSKIAERARLKCLKSHSMSVRAVQFLEAIHQ